MIDRLIDDCLISLKIFRVPTVMSVAVNRTLQKISTYRFLQKQHPYKVNVLQELSSRDTKR